MRIGHLSDIHVLDLSGVRAWQFLNKRLTGGLNLLLGRARLHRLEVLEAALRKIETLQCDHVVVTGDLTNLALAPEFERARGILLAHVPADRLSVIPGNHDRYTAGSSLTRRFETHFGAFAQTDLPELPQVDGWPFVKLLDPRVAIVGVSTAVAQPLLVSGGRVGRLQREALAAALAHPQVQTRFVVVLLHHHLTKPAHKKREFPRGLIDRKAVLDVLLRGGADLALHGHNHAWELYRVEREGSNGLLVAEAGSSSIVEAEKPERSGKFNIYDIDGGALRAVDTWAYQAGQGFALWRHWDPDGASLPVVAA